MFANRWYLGLIICALSSVAMVATSGSKVNRKLFVDANSVGFVDRRKDGFLIALDQTFADEYLKPIQLPTVLVTAVPMSAQQRGSRTTKIVYPEDFKDGKVIEIGDLHENSWFALCVEFENFNRHNETFGCTCGAYRTADRFGAFRQTFTNLHKIDRSPHQLKFEYSADVDFPVRLTFFLSNGSGGETKTFILRNGSRTNLLLFANLLQDTDYGSLCVVEEPLLSAYTVTGRLVDVKREFCFPGLTKTLTVSMETAANYSNFKENSRKPFLDAERLRKTRVADDSSGVKNSINFGLFALIVILSLFF